MNEGMDVDSMDPRERYLARARLQEGVDDKNALLQELGRLGESKIGCNEGHRWTKVKAPDDILKEFDRGTRECFPMKIADPQKAYSADAASSLSPIFNQCKACGVFEKNSGMQMSYRDDVISIDEDVWSEVQIEVKPNVLELNNGIRYQLTDLSAFPDFDRKLYGELKDKKKKRQEKIDSLERKISALESKYYKIGRAHQEPRSPEWQAAYQSYLNSEKWQKKRELVFKRDDHTCQACLESPAEEVHHLTYEHVGDEPLFDLQSVCSPCHRRITAMDKSKLKSFWPFDENAEKADPEKPWLSSK